MPINTVMSFFSFFLNYSYGVGGRLKREGVREDLDVKIVIIEKTPDVQLVINVYTG